MSNGKSCRLEHNPTGVQRGSTRLCFGKKSLERRSDPIRSNRALRLFSLRLKRRYGRGKTPQHPIHRFHSSKPSGRAG
ncbi:hypothetical protein C3731_09275 [Brucella oryzae]|uniref:Uncharacterized protein n=1 Tax=Brucella oryzae TaxID=335286 RepID=A0A2S7J0N1_9HYPH|nr:hypothetical protein C3731_09275 [Brucella oryzae]